MVIVRGDIGIADKWNVLCNLKLCHRPRRRERRRRSTVSTE